MRMVLAAALISGIALVSASAHAVTEDNFNVNTTGDLVALCSATVNEPMAIEATHFCHGFIVGAVRLQQTTQAASSRSRHFCLPGQMPTRAESITAFVDWARDDLKRLAMKPVDSMFAYLGGKYPCGKKS